MLPQSKLGQAKFLHVVLACFASTVAASAQNLGHRLGGDVYKPENTLRCYQLALAKLHDKPEFHYVELDIQETRDGKLVVFHDTGSIKRIVPSSAKNRAILARAVKAKKFEQVRIADLTLAQVERLRLNYNARIPTLEAVLDKSVKWKLSKPLLVEIKSLRTDACRQLAIDTVARYRNKLDVQFLAFTKAFRSSFPDQLRWQHELKHRGLKVFTAAKPKVDEFDLAARTKPSLPGLRFDNLLPESSFMISKSTGRTVGFSVIVPPVKGSQLRVRIGLEHGYDDTGDRSARVRVLNSAGRELLSGSSKSKGWQWFELAVAGPGNLTVEVDDLDTKFTGKNPGNRGRIKVNLARIE